MIIINNVSTKKQNRALAQPILNNLSCTLPTNKISVLTGPSGSGKTTLLRCIAGLEHAYSGQITINGTLLQSQSPQQRTSLVGFVTQTFNLFPHLTVLENCTQPLEIVQNMTSDCAKTHVYELLKHFGMDMYATTYPSQLSGGQQQRIAIIRALALGPKLMLLDEPSSALDPENTDVLIKFLLRLRTEGITFVIASHDMEFVRVVNDHIYSVKQGSITMKN